MQKQSESPQTSRSVTGMVEILIRLAAILALVVWCFAIIRPFIGPVAWGIIVAVALAAPFARLETALGGRSGVAATLLVVATVVLIFVPALQLSETLVTGARKAADLIDSGELAVPPPPEKVADWPLVGGPVHRFWKLASWNLESAIKQIEPQLKLLSGWLLSAARSAGLGALLFFLSLIVSGVILANRESATAFGQLFARRIAGSRGDEILELARCTTVSVATGIVGVAMIQAVLAGIGCMAAGVPGAGLVAMIVLVAAVVQVPVSLVLLPIVLYVYSQASTMVFVLFLVWSLVVGSLDNFLKPLMFGRGAKVPTLVIFLGAIGGMMSSGIIGLFTGSVVLAVGFELFRSWLYETTEPVAAIEGGRED
jgi:predicted PurR-regulated permease PerM